MSVIKRELISIRAEMEYDEDPDLSYLGRFTDNPNFDIWIDRATGRLMTEDKVLAEHKDGGVYVGRQDYSYFIPANMPHKRKSWAWMTKTEEGRESLKKVIAEHGSIEQCDYHYALQNWRRAEAYGNDDWRFINIHVVATYIENGEEQTINSGYLCGIESDSDKSYFKEVATDLLQEMMPGLLALGFDKRHLCMADVNLEVDL